MIHDNSSQHEPASVQNSIHFGACGWDMMHWRGSFYPDDLPEDWRLSYYANEFSAVLVPESVWRADSSGVEGWCDDVPENFQFFLQYKSTQLAEAEGKAIRQQLGSCFGGFVELSSKDSGISYDKNLAVAVISVQSNDLRGWREWLQPRADSLRAIFLDDPQLSYSELSDFKSLLELLNL